MLVPEIPARIPSLARVESLKENIVSRLTEIVYILAMYLVFESHNLYGMKLAETGSVRPLIKDTSRED